jgi:hypothetical protein
MINLCPAEVASYWVFEMGEPKTAYKFHVLTGEPDGRPPKLEALRYIAKNYLACEHFFRTYLEAFCELFLGMPFGAVKQKNPNCIFGIILTIMWSFEESGRRGIHGHATSTMPLLQPANLKKLCEDGDMKRMLLWFAESLATTYMPSAYHDGVIPEPEVSGRIALLLFLFQLLIAHMTYHLVHDLILTAVCSQGATDDLKAPKWDIHHYARGPDDFAAILRYLPLDNIGKDGAASKEDLKKWLAEVCRIVWHHHTITCKKNGCDGTDLSCRMAFMRLLVSFSHFVEGTGNTGFLLRRTQGNIVPYCRALLMAVPGNHMISLMPEMSRFAREKHIWELARQAGKEVGHLLSCSILQILQIRSY